MKLTGRGAVTNVLMFASAAGTLFVFSLGEIALPRFFELLLTSGGVALACDAVVVICAATLGVIDLRIDALEKRIRVASRKLAADLATQKDAMLTRKRDTFRAYLFTCLITAGANVWYRLDTMHNLPLALFVGAIPSALMYILNAILRPLPRDYEDEAQAATKEAIIDLVGNAHDELKMLLGRKHLRENDKQRLATALAAIGMYGNEREVYQLRTMSQTIGILPAETSVDAESVQTLLAVDDIVTRWGVSLRTAQDWMSKTPEAYKLNGQWCVPESAIMKRHPMQLRLASPRRKRMQSDAATMQENESSTPENDATPQDAA